MEWSFGITDSSRRSWRRREQRWEDEQLTAGSDNNYHQVMHKLCETALAKRRENGDYSIDSHLWSLKIASERALAEPRRRLDPFARDMDRFLGGESDSDSEDDQESDEQESERYDSSDQEEEDDGSCWRNPFPHGCLAIEKGRECDGKGEAKDSERN